MQKFNQFPPFEVSQNWFSGAELTLVTVLLAFSPVLGTMVAQAATPSLVPTTDDIPTMHWVWSILTLQSYGTSYTSLVRLCYATVAVLPACRNRYGPSLLP